MLYLVILQHAFTTGIHFVYSRFQSILVRDRSSPRSTCTIALDGYNFQPFWNQDTLVPRFVTHTMLFSSDVPATHLIKFSVFFERTAELLKGWGDWALEIKVIMWNVSCTLFSNNTCDILYSSLIWIYVLTYFYINAIIYHKRTNRLISIYLLIVTAVFVA